MNDGEDAKARVEATPAVNRLRVSFGRWRKWLEVEPLARRVGGVYLLGHFPEGPSTAVPHHDALPRGVVYVGQSKDLNRRPLSSHPREARYRELFGDDACASLWVAVGELYETGCADYAMKRVYADYVEMALAWEYASQHGHPLALHFKEGSETEVEIRSVVDAVRRFANETAAGR